MKKLLIFIVIVLFFSQCSLKKKNSDFKVKEIDVSYVDKKLIGIIRQYEAEFPSDSNFMLYFNLDACGIHKFGNGTYFTLAKFRVHRLEEYIGNLYRYFPLNYFVLDNKKVFIVPITNQLFSKEYTFRMLKENPWFSDFYFVPDINSWLIKRSNGGEYRILGKHCIWFESEPLIRVNGAYTNEFN